MKEANKIIFDFIWKGKDKVKRSALICDIEVTASSSSPMLLLFFLCCLFKQNDKSSTFHDGLSAVWSLDPGRILGRDGSHV